MTNRTQDVTQVRTSRLFTWLNELYELTQLDPSGLPWDSQAVIRHEYQRLLDYAKCHYILKLTEDGWIDCGMCADGL